MMPNFNAFMHRRNIFRKEPDFKKLAYDYQELKQFMTVGSKNKLKFDFKNPEALRALTCALLHRYFQKQITLPCDRLIPAVPQRLNYICWVEDLVKQLEIIAPDLNVFGIDIGTGASCIFPILACHRNPSWSFIGIEADAKSYSIAFENVQKNFMHERIRMIKISTDDTLNDILCLSTHPVTFIMCNPPFFGEEYGIAMEIDPSLNNASRPKSNSNTSDRIESVVSGGEIAFVGHILEQSRHLKEEVSIYTSMLGKKQSLTHFKQTLAGLSEENLSWTWAELCQGKTIRYAIAWSFKPGLDLTKAPLLRHGKNKSWKFKLNRKMPKRDSHLEFLENSQFLRNLVQRELNISKARITRQTSQTFEILMKTNDRTWTNQRRKRREQLNKHKHQATSSSVGFMNSSVKSPGPLVDGGDMSRGPGAFAAMVCDGYSSVPKCDPGQSVGADESTSTAVTMNLAEDDDNANANCIEMNTEGINLDGGLPLNPQINQLNNNPLSGAANQLGQANSMVFTRKRKNPSSCSSSPSRVCTSPNDELTDDDNQTTDSNTDQDERTDDAMNDIVEIKRICIKDTDDAENMDDIYDYLLCCRISLLRVCHDLYFELKLEHPCNAASDAYDLFQYFRNKLTEK